MQRNGDLLGGRRGEKKRRRESAVLLMIFFPPSRKVQGKAFLKKKGKRRKRLSSFGMEEKRRKNLSKEKKKGPGFLIRKKREKPLLHSLTERRGINVFIVKKKKGKDCSFYLILRVEKRGEREKGEKKRRGCLQMAKGKEEEGGRVF